MLKKSIAPCLAREDLHLVQQAFHVQSFPQCGVSSELGTQTSPDRSGMS